MELPDPIAVELFGAAKRCTEHKLTRTEEVDGTKFVCIPAGIFERLQHAVAMSAEWFVDWRP